MADLMGSDKTVMLTDSNEPEQITNGKVFLLTKKLNY